MNVIKDIRVYRSQTKNIAGNSLPHEFANSAIINGSIDVSLFAAYLRIRNIFTYCGLCFNKHRI